LKRRESPLYRALIGVLLSSGVIQLANGVSGLDSGHALLWRRVALLGEVGQPAALLYLGVELLRAGQATAFTPALWHARAVGLLAAIVACVAWSDRLYGTVPTDLAVEVISLNALGQVAYVFVILALVLGIAQIEQILRAIRDPLRYQLKFV